MSAVLPTRTAVPSHLIAPPRARCHDHSSAPPGHRSCCNHSPAAGPAQSRHCPPDECFTAAISDIDISFHCSEHDRSIVLQLLRSVLQCEAFLCHCCEHDLTIFPQLRRSVLLYKAILFHCCEHDLAIIPQFLRGAPQCIGTSVIISSHRCERATRATPLPLLPQRTAYATTDPSAPQPPLGRFPLR